MSATSSKSLDPIIGKGLINGLIGVVIFSATLPATRLAVPELGAWFLSIGRAAIAGLLAFAWLQIKRPPPMDKSDRNTLIRTALGVVIGFPLFSSLAMRLIPASHGAVITGLLPLATAIGGAWLARERLKTGFWIAALVGSGLVVSFALRNGSGQLQAGDALMGVAVILGAMGYAEGGRLSQKYGGPRVICSALALTLPLTLPAAIFLAWKQNLLGPGAASISWPAWAGLAYISLFSMWLGFFFWYKGLAQGGVAKVGQIQLLQPFFTLICATVLLAEPFDLVTVAFALAVIATIAIGRKLS